MTFIAVVGMVFAVLFGMAYMTKRRFGVLGLALMAGAAMAGMWASELTPYVADAGIVLVRPPLASVVALGLTLAPALILLFSGPAAYKKPERMLGALAFALLAITLMIKPLGDALIVEGLGMELLSAIKLYSPIIITACVAYAIFDVFMTHTVRPGGKDKKKD